MSLLPDSATFHERVQDCFVAYRARGLSLSPKDVELVEGWAESGVPFEVVARGIRKAADAALWDAPDGEAVLRSLAACRRHVDAEIQKYLKRAAGRTETPEAGAPAEEPFHLARHKKLKAALKKLGKDQPALHGAISAWLKSLPPPADFDAANRQEELVWALLVRALPFTSRRSLLHQAHGLVQKAGAMSAQARRESLRFHRAALVRHELSVPAFW